ncbi:MAG: hypothetical protein A2075_19325 [Geobacteraceae bacterium GWC2_58_44]|nr:MAG: hypothetical protein A2075_19325 [Geobacteraceae bacterium GWC2_58_44]HBG07557.1 hypothetical protein [Geobacter sp.]
MRRQFRPLALLTCITAATAFGSQFAAADTGSAPGRSELSGGQHKHKGHRGEKQHEKMAKELGLTDQQKSRAKALREANRAENKPAFSALMTEKRQLRALVHSGSADEAAIRAQAAKVAYAEADLAVKRAQASRQFLDLLTPDQAAKYKEMQAKRESRPKRFGSCDDKRGDHNQEK